MLMIRCLAQTSVAMLMMMLTMMQMVDGTGLMFAYSRLSCLTTAVVVTSFDALPFVNVQVGDRKIGSTSHMFISCIARNDT